MLDCWCVVLFLFGVCVLLSPVLHLLCVVSRVCVSLVILSCRIVHALCDLFCVVFLNCCCVSHV